MLKKRPLHEPVLLTVLLFFALYGICWGPPDPPIISTPVSAPETLAVTAALIAGYGLWKNRK